MHSVPNGNYVLSNCKTFSGKSRLFLVFSFSYVKSIIQLDAARTKAFYINEYTSHFIFACFFPRFFVRFVLFYSVTFVVLCRRDKQTAFQRECDFKTCNTLFINSLISRASSSNFKMFRNWPFSSPSLSIDSFRRKNK